MLPVHFTRNTCHDSSRQQKSLNNTLPADLTTSLAITSNNKTTNSNYRIVIAIATLTNNTCTIIMTITYKAMIQRETNTSRPRPRSIHNSNSNIIRHNNHFRLSSMSSLNRHSTVTSSILRRASQEVMRRHHNRHVAFSATRDTTYVYPKGLTLPLAVQKTFVFNGASRLRASSRRAIMADHRMCRISQTYGNRHVGFGPDVEFTGRVTLQPLLEMPIGILQPILEEEEAEVGLVEPALGVEDMEVEPIREEDSTVVATRRPIKRRWDTTTTAEDDAAPEHKFKRARVCADESQVQSVEVSGFLLFLISYFFLVSIFFIPI